MALESGSDKNGTACILDDIDCEGSRQQNGYCLVENARITVFGPFLIIVHYNTAYFKRIILYVDSVFKCTTIIVTEVEKITSIVYNVHKWNFVLVCNSSVQTEQPPTLNRIVQAS